MDLRIVAVGVAVLMFILKGVRRSNDPLDYASLAVHHEPRISIARFIGLDVYDRISHASGIASITEFSRVYQSSFLAETDAMTVLRDMSRCRLKMHREFHALRLWLPNDAALEHRILAGIEETDAAMALAMKDVTARFPNTKLAFGAGVLGHPTLRSDTDVWV